MIDHTKALADAARRAAERIIRCCGDYSEMQSIAEELFDAIAAYDAAQAQPAPTDATTPPTDDYDALGHAMEILGGCATKYSCEQAQAVAKVLRQWRDKWALAVDSIPVMKPQEPAPTDAEWNCWMDRIAAQFIAIARFVEAGDMSDVAIHECHKGERLVHEAFDSLRRGGAA